MHYINDPGDANLAGWANDLFSTGATGKVCTEPDSLVYSRNNFIYHPVPETYGSSPGYILRNSDGTDFGAGGSGGSLASFTLRKMKQGAGAVNTEFVNLVVGALEWATVNGDYPIMQAGANAPVLDGGAAGTDLGEVIRILNVPEPSSVALLALVSPALLHRRRKHMARG